MRSVTIGLVLLLPFGTLGATAAIEPAVSVQAKTPVKKERLAETDNAKECPTSYEVRSYIWIEPKTGREYKMLNFYCPGLDEG